MGRIFFQDFLFKDMPVDEQDNPKVALKEYRYGHPSKDIEVSLDCLLKNE